jgi:hypothetical protein
VLDASRLATPPDHAPHAGHRHHRARRADGCETARPEGVPEHEDSEVGARAAPDRAGAWNGRAGAAQPVSRRPRKPSPLPRALLRTENHPAIIFRHAANMRRDGGSGSPPGSRPDDALSRLLADLRHDLLGRDTWWPAFPSFPQHLLLDLEDGTTSWWPEAREVLNLPPWRSARHRRDVLAARLLERMSPAAKVTPTPEGRAVGLATAVDRLWASFACEGDVSLLLDDRELPVLARGRRAAAAMARRLLRWRPWSASSG